MNKKYLEKVTQTQTH